MLLCKEAKIAPVIIRIKIHKPFPGLFTSNYSHTTLKM